MKMESSLDKTLLLKNEGILKSETLEIKTIYTMLEIYCGAHHHPTQGLCQTCTDLYVYAVSRVLNCPIRMAKPPCEMCHIHCYKPDLRKSVKAVMRYSGPRMVYYHPLLAMRHLIARYRHIRLQSKTCQSK